MAGLSGGERLKECELDGCACVGRGVPATTPLADAGLRCRSTQQQKRMINSR